MGSPWKILLPLALILPLGAYVVGALASPGDEPQPREPIQLEAPTSGAEPGGATEPSTNPAQKDPKPNPKQKPDQARDPSGPGGDSGRGHVVPPQPYTGDDDGDDDADDDGDDDGDDDTDDG